MSEQRPEDGFQSDKRYEFYYNATRNHTGQSFLDEYLECVNEIEIDLSRVFDVFPVSAYGTD